MHALLLIVAMLVLNPIRPHTRWMGGGLYLALLIYHRGGGRHRMSRLGLGIEYGIARRHERFIYRRVTMTVVLCKCSERVHLSSCVGVLEHAHPVKHAFELTRFVRKSFLDFWRI